MEGSDYANRVAVAQEKARKVRDILADNKVSMSEAICFASEMFQILAVMGELNPRLVSGLTLLTLKLQDNELTNGLLTKSNLSNPSTERVESSPRIEGRLDNI